MSWEEEEELTATREGSLAFLAGIRKYAITHYLSCHNNVCSAGELGLTTQEREGSELLASIYTQIENFQTIIARTLSTGQYPLLALLNRIFENIETFHTQIADPTLQTKIAINAEGTPYEKYERLREEAERSDQEPDFAIDDPKAALFIEQISTIYEIVLLLSEYGDLQYRSAELVSRIVGVLTQFTLRYSLQYLKPAVYALVTHLFSFDTHTSTEFPHKTEVMQAVSVIQQYPLQN